MMAGTESAVAAVPLVQEFCDSVDVRASKYSRLDEGGIFQATANTLKIVAVWRRKWNLR